MMEQHREKTLQEFYRDISFASGQKVGFATVRAEKRNDPVVSLKRPLGFYDSRVFYYAGLLYGFCRVDASITERFREATGSSIKTELYKVDHPLMTVQGFPDFERTRIAHLLSGVEVGPMQQCLFDFMASQTFVDRRRNKVWRCRIEVVNFPDPYLVDVKDPSLVSVSLPVFVPYQWDTAYIPVQHDKGGLKDPVVGMYPEDHEDFKVYTERELNAKTA